MSGLRRFCDARLSADDGPVGKVIPLQRYVNRLEENVASLTRANILSQDYAKDIELESRARERDRLTRDIHDAIGYT